MSGVQLGDLLRQVSCDDDDARRDAEVLLGHLLGKPRSYLFAFPEKSLDAATTSAFRALWSRRSQGEPVAYLTGRKAFWSFELEVGPQTLVPRPDTEILVQAILDRYDGAPINVLELGTGTGAIALALAIERPAWRIRATDIDRDSVALAERNALSLQIDSIAFQQSDWFERVPAEPAFDVIVSNPPYIAEHHPLLRSHGVRAEPRRALVAGPSGLDDIHKIIAGAGAFLVAGGCLAMEHGHEQGVAVRASLMAAGYENAITIQDLSGADRVSLAYWPSV